MVEIFAIRMIMSNTSNTLKFLHTPERRVLRAVDHVERLKPSLGEDVATEGYDSSVVLESNWRSVTL